ncbi:hypothetical protein EC991_007905 [Linnemannia zychae]|nr:hypothetical protein EC991_007905 [Linnemannia zychae]
MPPFISLPLEIIDLILAVTSKEDYASCYLVDHLWLIATAPYFWREVRMVAKSGNKRLVSIEARNALARNAHHIRVLETTDPSVVYTLATFQPPITGLEALTIRLQNPIAPLVEIQQSDDVVIPAVQSTNNEIEDVNFPRCSSILLEILRNNSGLRFLSLDEGYFRYKDGKEGFLDLYQAFPTAHLEKLEVSFRRDPSSTAHPDDHNNITEMLTAEREASFFPIQTPFLALTEIAITAEKTVTMDPRRLMFLRRCSSLERIRIARLDDLTMRLIPFILKAFCPKMTCLEWTNPYFDVEDNIQQLIQSTTLGWKELRLPNMQEFGHDGFNALMFHSDTLEVLKVESGGERLAHNAAVDLLCRARNLRRLEGPADGQRTRFTQELTVFAYDTYWDHIQGVADRTWVLGSSVEFLQLRIDGVPRPDVLYRQDGEELTFELYPVAPAMRFTAQGWIYLQLNRMDNLQELILGVTDFGPWELRYHELDELPDPDALEEVFLKRDVPTFNYQSLEFSLESGLILLGGLKKLRVLDVRRTAHRIGVAELEWMHSNWPNLKEIRGLVTERKWAGPSQNGVNIKEEVEGWLAAHPNGIGCNYF